MKVGSGRVLSECRDVILWRLRAFHLQLFQIDLNSCYKIGTQIRDN